MKHQPKAIFFDLDETLVENVEPIQRLFRKASALLDQPDYQSQVGEINQELYLRTLQKGIGGLWNTMFDTQESPETQLMHCFRVAICAASNAKDQVAEDIASAQLEYLGQLSRGNVVLQEGALETLRSLRKYGVVTGIITNGMERLQLGKIETLKLQNEVDHVTVSAQARAHKPHKPVFDLALQRANENQSILPGQAWQVGDHATNDVAGAIRAGMGGIFYDPTNIGVEAAFSELTERPTHHIRKLSDILQLLEC